MDNELKTICNKIEDEHRVTVEFGQDRFVHLEIDDKSLLNQQLAVRLSKIENKSVTVRRTGIQWKNDDHEFWQEMSQRVSRFEFLKCSHTGLLDPRDQRTTCNEHLLNLFQNSSIDWLVLNYFVLDDELCKTISGIDGLTRLGLHEMQLDNNVESLLRLNTCDKLETLSISSKEPVTEQHMDVNSKLKFKVDWFQIQQFNQRKRYEELRKALKESSNQ